MPPPPHPPDCSEPAATCKRYQGYVSQLRARGAKARGQTPRHVAEPPATWQVATHLDPYIDGETSEMPRGRFVDAVHVAHASWRGGALPVSDDLVLAQYLCHAISRSNSV